MTTQDVTLISLSNVFNVDATTSAATTIKASALSSATPTVNQVLTVTSIVGNAITLGWGSGGGTPGGSNTNFQYNNNGVFAGTSGLFWDSTNDRASALSPVNTNNVARLSDVQNAISGIRPQNPIGSTVHVTVAALPNNPSYTNGTGVGSSTLIATTNGALSINNVLVAVNDIVVVTFQGGVGTGNIQNGSYTVSATGSDSSTYTLRRTLVAPAYGNLWTVTANGASNSGYQYICVTVSPVIGTTLIQYDLFNSVGIPTLDQVLRSNNTSSTGLGITSPGTVSTPVLTLRNSAGNTIMISSPPSLSNYSVTMPDGPPGLGSSLIAVDTLGKLDWLPSGVEIISATATSNTALTGLIIVDGYTPATNERILATAQTTASQNGLYVVNTTGPWQKVDTYYFQSVFTRFGSNNAGKSFTRTDATTNEQWILTSSLTNVTPGLNQVTAIDPNSTRTITIQPTDGFALSLSGSARAGSPTIAVTSATGSDIINLLLNTKGSGSSVGIFSGTNQALLIRPLSGSNAYHIIDAGSNELRLATTSTPGFSMGNLASDGTVAASSCALNVRSVASTTSPTVNAILRLRAFGNPISSPNVDVQIEPAGTGKLGLGLESTGGVYLGQPNLKTFATPLFAAPNAAPAATASFSSGTLGQVLVSAGGSRTPYWASAIPIYSYALSGDQTLPATPFTFNTTATFSQGASFGSWTSSSTFTFTSVGIYLAIFSFNVTSGAADMSLVFNGNRVAGATGSGKQEMTGFGNITAANQTFQVQNYVSAGFAASQSNVTLLKIA